MFVSALRIRSARPVSARLAVVAALLLFLASLLPVATLARRSRRRGPSRATHRTRPR